MQNPFFSTFFAASTRLPRQKNNLTQSEIKYIDLILIMPRATTSPQSRDWCFTVQVKQGEDAEVPEAPAPPQFNEEHMVYLIYQLEVAPTTGQKHWQGFCQFRQRKRMRGARDLLGAGGVIPHVEPRRGTPKEASNYCRKCDKHSSYTESCRDCLNDGDRVVVHGELRESKQVRVRPEHPWRLITLTDDRCFRRRILRRFYERNGKRIPPYREWELR
jgi:hypothetical protein